MKLIVKIRFSETRKVMVLNAGSFALSRGDRVVVETEAGLRIGMVLSEPVEKDSGAAENCRIMRKVTEEDLALRDTYSKREADAARICLQKISDHRLPMKLVRTEYNLSGSKVIFYFTSDGRVDFRSLVRDLAQTLRTRIEMRQIGVRDETKIIGGIGSCGRELCCSTFLRSFAPVSIRMAKDQGIALNPQKISGICGRLMCCLAYEEGVYQEALAGLPRIGKKVSTPAGEGKVKEYDALRRRVKVQIEFKLHDFSPEELKPVGGEAEEAQPEPAETAVSVELEDAIDDSGMVQVIEDGGDGNGRPQ